MGLLKRLFQRVSKSSGINKGGKDERMVTLCEDVRESSQGQEILNKLLTLIKEKENGIQKLGLLIIILFTLLVDGIIFPFVCTMNSSLEVFRGGLLPPYLHSDLFR